MAHSNPAPTAQPLIAAITIFSFKTIWRVTSWSSRASARASSALYPVSSLLSDSFMSLPVQKARPAPCRIITLVSSSALASVSARRRAVINSALIAFRLPGRFSVRMRMLPFCSDNTTLFIWHFFLSRQHAYLACCKRFLFKCLFVNFSDWQYWQAVPHFEFLRDFVVGQLFSAQGT